MSGLDQVPGSDIKPWARREAQGYCFINANVVDVQAGKLLEGATVTTRHGKIQSLAVSTPDPLPSDATVIDCKGRYLCPGLFDAHVHLCAVPGSIQGIWKSERCPPASTTLYGCSNAASRLHQHS